MMPPGHIAATWGVAHLMQQTNPRLARLDYRWLAVSAMAADIIDKPLALFLFTDTHTSQLLAHSLSLSLLLLTLSLLFWRSGLPYALAFAGHLIADRMWNHPESFWWPFFGWQTFWQFKPMNTPAVMLNVYLDIITRYPQVWVIEIIALFYLLWFAVRFRLYRWAELKHFVLTGRTVRPEEWEISADNSNRQLPQEPVGSV